MKICMIGTGYVGLVTGACFAEMGHHVSCVDENQEKINTLRSGILPIYEPGLEYIVQKNSKEGRISFTTDSKIGLEQALFCFIAVGTPQCGDGSADLYYIFTVAREIGRCMNGYLLIVVKSTVPVGTIEKVRDVIKGELQVRGKEDLEFEIASKGCSDRGTSYAKIGGTGRTRDCTFCTLPCIRSAIIRDLKVLAVIHNNILLL